MAVKLHAGYSQHLHRRGLSPGTIRKRLACVAMFMAWLAPLSVADADRSMVETFLDGRGLGDRTRCDWVSHLHCFYQWAVTEACLADDPTERVMRPKLPRLLPRPIQDDDLLIALDAATGHPRMSAWLHLAAFAGLRVGEISGLDVGDVQFSARMVRVLGKGRKERVIPLHEEAVVALRRCRVPSRGPLFTRPDGTPWSAQKVSHYGNQFLHGLGLPETMHQLRHWFGTKAYEASGGDLRVVQELMGHSSPVTTAGYTMVSGQRGRIAIDGIAFRASEHWSAA